MKKRIAPLVWLVVFCITLLYPFCISATAPLDPMEDASLTLHYQKEGRAFEGLTVDIYRVAEALSDGTFSLIEPYASYPIQIHDITAQEQWKHTASTIRSYVVANQITSDYEGVTDANGVVSFENVKTGLYYVSEVVAEDAGGSYVFDQFMIYLPTPQADGSFVYDVEANPKCVNYVPKTEYRVTKLWQDSGNEGDRPQEVAVQIYKDGNLQETKILCAENNWSYAWRVPADADGKWTVMEETVAKEYTVTIQQNGECFSIVNTHKLNIDPPDNPQTGDTVALLPWILTMCIAGVLILINWFIW